MLPLPMANAKKMDYFNSIYIKELQERTNHLMVAMKYKHMLTPTPYHSH
jgi:hypothetical protein